MASATAQGGGPSGRKASATAQVAVPAAPCFYKLQRRANRVTRWDPLGGLLRRHPGPTQRPAASSRMVFVCLCDIVAAGDKPQLPKTRSFGKLGLVPDGREVAKAHKSHTVSCQRAFDPVRGSS